MSEFLKRASRLVAISTAGAVLVVLGTIMLFTPGPGWLLIILGLAVFATEFAWAERLKQRALERINDLRTNTRLGRFGVHRIDLTDEADDAREGDDSDAPPSGDEPASHRRTAA